MKFEDLKNGRTILSKEQMRMIKGGSGTCGVVSSTGSVFCGVSKAQALHMYAGGGDGARWCCDSCGTTSYCGK